MIHTKTTEGYILRFHKGDELFPLLTNFCKEHNITAGVFSGIGAALEVELGFYHLDTKKYAFRTLNEPLEVVSMTGNVALVDGEQFLHIHGVFSDPQLACYGGHINALTVGPTLEVYLTPHDTTVVREYDEEIGLKLCTFPGRD